MKDEAMLDAKPVPTMAKCPVHMDQPGTGRLAHAEADHPAVPQAKIGVLVANLGTPDNYDYWSMRRYLNEFLSDKRVVDYPRMAVATPVATGNPDQAAVHLLGRITNPSGTWTRMKARF